MSKKSKTEENIPTLEQTQNVADTDVHKVIINEPLDSPAANELATPEASSQGNVQTENQNLLDKKSQELAAMNDKYLRLYAEFENYKKRKEEEKKQLLKSANEKLLKEFLVVIDSFDQALSSMELEDQDSTITKGVQLIYKQVESFITKHHIIPISAVGEKFDPNFHNAVMQAESQDHAPDLVIKELQKGYMFHDKVLRPTMAVVSK